MDTKSIFHIETNTGELLNAIKKVSSIIKAKGGRIKGNRLIYFEVNNFQFRIFVENVTDSVSISKISGKGKISLNFNGTLKAIKTYPKNSIMTIEAFNDYLLVNGNLELNEQYSSVR